MQQSTHSILKFTSQELEVDLKLQIYLRKKNHDAIHLTLHTNHIGQQSTAGISRHLTQYLTRHHFRTCYC